MTRAVITALPLVITLLASPALAHCFPDKATPAEASASPTPPSQVEVHFDSPFKPAHTSVRVLNRNGDVVSGADVSSADDRTMTAPLKALGPGQYFVKWRATSQDGAHTMGSYSFTVTDAR
jgi:methionine-rich copper-binding protein CopC